MQHAARSLLRLCVVPLAVTLAGCNAPAKGGAQARLAASAPASRLERAVLLLEATRYEEAERLLRAELPAAQEPGAALALARLLLETGRYQEASDVAASVHADGSELLIRALALRELGRSEEALSILPLSVEATQLRLRLEVGLLRGELLLGLGRRQEAEGPLLAIVASENAGQFEGQPPAERAFALALLGRAAHLLRAPEDANDAFNESEELGPASVRALAWRAELFLEKYDVGHAEEVLLELLEQAPHHSDALVLLARVRLERALDFGEAERLVRLGLRTNPDNPRARFVLAGNALHDLDFATTEREISLGLRVNPRDVDLLSMQAAARFLAEDLEGFERLAKQVQELRPGTTRLFEVTSEFAQWEHRYEDIEKLLRRATRLDREDGRVRGELGLVLVRSGSDAAGVVELREAFRLDPYNVRVLNTLDLYEKAIPQGYDEVRHGPFTFRYPKAERAVLERYVPALLDEAHQQMVARYGYTPRAPLGIEIYASTSEFAVRTTGLPRAALAGVCFGRKLATVSPSGQPANLGMTLWHELSHVFHIGLSESRVPRWLTEGFAEWETAGLGRGWSREMDDDLFRALREGRLPELGKMSRAFTHAESMQDVATAYHASKRLADWIVATRGPETAARLLAEFGKKRLPDAVVPEVLGAPFEQLDEQFRAWLRLTLAHYERQFVSPSVRGELGDLRARAEAGGASRLARRDYALALVRDGHPDQASPRLEALLEEREEPALAFALARASLAQGDKVKAARWLHKMLAEGHDGYELRMVLARLAATEQNWQEMAEQAARASALAGEQQAAWSLRATAAHELGDQAGELEAVGGWAELSEHDGAIHRRYLELLLGAERWQEARAAAERAVWAGLGVFETHRLVAEAFARAGLKKRADFEWATAELLAVRPEDKARLAQDRARLR